MDGQRQPGSYVVESLWPGVDAADIRRAEARFRELADPEARYVGSILMREDEVVLWELQGTVEAVRRLAERAGVPFDRILEASVTTATPRPGA